MEEWASVSQSRHVISPTSRREVGLSSPTGHCWIRRIFFLVPIGLFQACAVPTSCQGSLGTSTLPEFTLFLYFIFSIPYSVCSSVVTENTRGTDIPFLSPNSNIGFWHWFRWIIAAGGKKFRICNWFVFCNYVSTHLSTELTYHCLTSVPPRSRGTGTLSGTWL